MIVCIVDPFAYCCLFFLYLKISSIVNSICMYVRPPAKRVFESYFLISQPKHFLWVLKRDGSFEHPKHMFKLMDKKIFTMEH